MHFFFLYQYLSFLCFNIFKRFLVEHFSNRITVNACRVCIYVCVYVCGCGFMCVGVCAERSGSFLPISDGTGSKLRIHIKTRSRGMKEMK